MALSDILRSGVAIANRVTGDLQVTVKHSAWTGTNNYGKPVYATAIERLALVDFKQQMRRQVNGQEILQVAKVTFLEPIDPNYAPGRREPIDQRDKIVLPNGFTGPILDVGGFVDSATDAPYLLEVALGEPL